MSLLCRCGRKALYRYKGKVRSDGHHTMCPRCFRAAMNRARADQMRWLAAGAARIARGQVNSLVGSRGPLGPPR
jgi:hypothetical protein